MKQLSVFVLFFVLSSALNAAQIYKWTDAKGKTHYTQTPPPPEAEQEYIAPPPEVSFGDAATSDATGDATKQDEVDKTSEEQGQKAKPISEECRSAKRAYQMVMHSGAKEKTKADDADSAAFMDEEPRSNSDKMHQMARDNIARHCNNSDSAEDNTEQ